MIGWRKAAFFALVLIDVPLAASFDWPRELVRPSVLDAADSTGFRAVTSQNLYERVWRSYNRGLYQFSDSTTYFKQLVQHELTFDRSTSLRTRDNTWDLAGAVFGSHLPERYGRLGLEWHPFVRLKQLHTETNQSRFQGDVDFGPSYLISLRGIPTEAKAGVSARLWNTEVDERLWDTRLDDFSWRGGVFGSLDLGRFDQSLGGRPHHAVAKVYARTLGEQTRLIGGQVRYLGYQGLQTGDSLFAHVADTLVHGDNAKLTEITRGISGFRDEPSITEHGLGLTLGFKGVSRLYIQPGLIYTFRTHQKTYPWNPGIVRDVKRLRVHQLSGILAADTSLPLLYKGGLSIRWEDENWLFDRIPTTTPELLTNRNDYGGIRIETNHHALARLPLGMALGYSFSIYRYSKSFVRDDSTESRYGANDRDEILQEHDLKFMFLTFPRCSLDVFGGYSEYLSHYLNRAQSANNTVNRSYDMGLHAAVIPLKTLRLSETVGLNADVSSYEFPERHIGDPPLYSRLFFSNFQATYAVFPRATLGFTWETTYVDEGFWDGQEYRDSLLSDSTRLAAREEYTIQTKTLTNRLLLSAQYNPFGSFEVEMGAEIRDEFPREYANDDYRVRSDIDEGDRVFPFLAIRDRSSRYPLMFEGRIQSHIYVLNRKALTEAQIRESAELRSWEVSLVGRAFF